MTPGCGAHRPAVARGRRELPSHGDRRRAELASAIISESIPPERRDDYLLWIRGINKEAESFPGYRETNVFPPLGPDGREWITIIHFETHADLESWPSSPVRAEWVDRFRRDFGDFALHRIQGGLTSWFGQQRLPGWKMALTVLPLLPDRDRLITLVWSCPAELACRSLSMLIGNFLNVSALKWIVMPCGNRVLSVWLQPVAAIDRGSNVVATVLVVVVRSSGRSCSSQLVRAPARLKHFAIDLPEGMMSRDESVYDEAGGVVLLAATRRRGPKHAGQLATGGRPTCFLTPCRP